jgi:phage-related protein
MNMNPIGLIITAIGILIGAIYLLVTNWDTVKAVLIKGAQAVGAFFTNIFTAVKNWIVTAFNNVVGFFKTWGPRILIALGGPFVWAGLLIYKNFDKIKAFLGGVVEWIGSAFSGVGKFIGDVFNGLVNILKAPINGIIGMVNMLIKAINGINIKVPDWVPVVGGKQIGFKIPEIPMLAKGTKNFKGGQAIVGEEGPELVSMKRGSQVIPTQKTQDIFDKAERRGISIGSLVEKIVIEGYNKDPEELLDLLIQRLKQLLEKADEIAGSTEMGVLLDG